MMGKEEKKLTEVSQVRFQKRAVGPKIGQPEEAQHDPDISMIKTESAVLSAL